jgi:hypothetical protein
MNHIQRLESAKESAQRRVKLAEHPALIGRFDLIARVLDSRVSIDECERIVADAQVAAQGLR